jgi:ParB-like chromosome segregation protein Spo0J
VAAKGATTVVEERLEVGPDLFVARVSIDDLREQDVNAHYMSPKTFDRLVENIKLRGALESMPYCAQPGGEGLIEIVSGHHRVRAAKVAGLTWVAILLDVSKMTRSTMLSSSINY